MASKSRKNKVKFKLTKELVFLVVGILVILAATIVMGIPTKAQKQLDSYNKYITEYNAANSQSYNTLTEGHVFKDITYNGLVKKANDKDAEYVYVFYGNWKLDSFVKYVSTINSTAKSFEVNRVYLMYTTWIDKQDDKDSIEFKQALEEKNKELNKNVNANQKEFDLSKDSTSTLLVYNKGELIFNSQTYEKEEYTWELFINKAFTTQYEGK